VWRYITDVLAIEPHRPLSESLESGDDPEKGGLPATTRSGDRDHFTGRHREREVVDDSSSIEIN
jgi:hypothetical protein